MIHLLTIIIIILFSSDLFAQTDLIEINEILFEGNEFFSASTLSEKITSKKSDILNTNNLNESALGEDVNILNSFYINEGFFDVRIEDYQIQYNTNKTKADITFKINEGRWSKIRTINISGSNYFSNEFILENLSFNLGDRYQYYEIIASEMEIRKLLIDNGYLDAEVTNNFIYDKLEKSVDLVFDITENNRISINNIFIKNLEITDPSVVQRELEFKEREYINLESFMRTKRKLYRTDLFRRVLIKSVDTKDSSDLSRDIEIELVEEDPGEFEISVGYGTIEKFKTSSMVSYDNIGGLAYGASLEGVLSEIERKIELTLTDPWIFGLPLGISLIGGYENGNEPSFDYSLYTASVNFYKDFSLNSKISLSAIYNIYTYKNLSPGLFENEDIRDDLSPEEIKFIIENLDYSFDETRIKLSYVHDQRNNFINPQKGFYFDISSEFIFGISEINIGKEYFDNTINRILKNQISLDYFYPLASDFILASSIQLGILNNFSEDSEIYFLNDLFYTGGPNSIRGFEYKKVGPLSNDRDPLGGQLKMVWNLFELRSNIYGLLDGVLFLDIGNVWRKINDFHFKDLRYSPGFGLRFESPIGIIRFDYGFNPARESGEETGQYWIGVGHTF